MVSKCNVKVYPAIELKWSLVVGPWHSIRLHEISLLESSHSSNLPKQGATNNGDISAAVY